MSFGSLAIMVIAIFIVAMLTFEILLKPAPNNTKSINPRWMKLWFICLGKIAKGDGVVSKEEAAYIDALLCAFGECFGVSQANQLELVVCFKIGRDSRLPFANYVTDLQTAANDEKLSLKQRAIIINTFCTIAIADGAIHPNELSMLQEAGRVFGLEEVVYDFFAGLNEYIDKKIQEEKTLDESYELLGVLPSSSDSEVKSAYRRKAKECHPDFAEAAGLSSREVLRAKEKFQELAQAYEVICKHRNMK